MRLISFLICRLFPTFLLSIILVSCHPVTNRNDQQGEIHLPIDPAHLPPFAKLSELVKSVRLIPLETSKNSLIGYTNKIFVGENSILISTQGNSPEIFHFTSNGKFLNKIGNQGQGPGEFSDISNLEVIQDSSCVYIQGWRMRKILQYSFDGKFTREISFGKGLSNATILDQNRIAFTSYRDYEVMIVNALTRDTLKYIKISPETESQLHGFYGDLSMGFFYSALGRDTIWRIGPESMYPIIICDFGSGHFSSHDYIGSLGRAGGYPPGKLSIGGGMIYGSGFYLFAMLRENEKKEYTYCRVVVQENTGNSWHLEQGPESDDILFCTSTDFRTVASSGEWVSVVGPEEVIAALPQIKANKNFKYPSELIAQIEKLTIEDNPVLVLYNLK
jgi:hypothetical protein